MSQHVRVKLCTSRKQLDKQHDIWLSCSLEEGHPGQHSAAAYNRKTFWGDAVTEAAQQPRESLSAAQVKHMVERFLRWRLPEDFNPDGGVSFKKLRNEGTPYEGKNEPVGTNLLDATQAED